MPVDGRGDVSAGMAELVKAAQGKTCLVVLDDVRLVLVWDSLL